MNGPPEQIPVFDVRVTDEDLVAVEDALRSGWLTMGERTERFEREFAESIGSAHAVALSSCTAALHLACLAADIGPGDEVIVPSMTFAATANAVRYTGATPVFADVVSERDLGIDVDHVETLVNERTRAVIPVHYAGYPVAIDRLGELCAGLGLTMIEDVAHAPSARLHPGGEEARKLRRDGLLQLLPQQGPRGRRGRGSRHRLRGDRRAGPTAALSGDDRGLNRSASRLRDRLRRVRARLQLSLRRSTGGPPALAVPSTGAGARADDGRSSPGTGSFWPACRS